MSTKEYLGDFADGKSCLAAVGALQQVQVATTNLLGVEVPVSRLKVSHRRDGVAKGQALRPSGSAPTCRLSQCSLVVLNGPTCSVSTGEGSS